jgi:hypothetical protein
MHAAHHRRPSVANALYLSECRRFESQARIVSLRLVDDGFILVPVEFEPVNGLVPKYEGKAET